jgi:hypothetical protein
LLAGLDTKLAPIELGRTLISRYEIAVKRHRGAEASRVLDSLTALGGRGAPGEIQLYVALLNAAAGRVSYYDSLIAPSPLPLPIKRYFSESVRLAVGFPTDSFIAVEREAPAALASFPPFAQQVGLMMRSTLLLGLRLPRREWPKIVLESSDTVLAAARAAALGDTATLRAAARRLDSLSRTPTGASDAAAPMVAAEIYLVLRDSLAALQQVRRALDSLLPTTPFAATMSSGFGGVTLLYPRAMRQRAELAAALGFRDEARVWYQRFLELWVKPDPEFQPAVARVRAAYQALGPG